MKVDLVLLAMTIISVLFLIIEMKKLRLERGMNVRSDDKKEGQNYMSMETMS